MGSAATTVSLLEVAVSPELGAMLKLAHRAHPKLQAILVDLSCYGGKVTAKTDLAPQGIAWGPDPDWKGVREAIEEEDLSIQALAPSLETE